MYRLASFVTGRGATVAAATVGAGLMTIGIVEPAFAYPTTDFLRTDSWTALNFLEYQDMSPDTKAIFFQYVGSAGEQAGLDTSSCVLARARINGEFVVRPYTPISPLNDTGYIGLAVKKYPDGKMSSHLHNLKRGDTVEFKGGFVKYPYKPNHKKYLGFIAGGTGLFPFIQIMRAVCENPRDNTEIRLIYANKTPSDILFKPWLDTVAFAFPNVKVMYVVEKPEEGWTGATGRVTAKMIREFLPPPVTDTMIMVCGPPGMMTAVSGEKDKEGGQGHVAGLLKDLHYTDDMVFKF